jgi:hypothetical protein
MFTGVVCAASFSVLEGPMLDFWQDASERTRADAPKAIVLLMGLDFIRFFRV